MNTLVLHLSEDAYQGDAIASITVDTGKPMLVTVTALHAAGVVQDVPCGSYDDGAHQVSVTFTNDAWGGTPALDRNLYLVGATFGGVAVPGATAALLAAGTFTFPVPAGIALTLANLAAREDREDAEIAALEAKIAALSPAPIVMPPPVVTPPVAVAAPVVTPPAPPVVTTPAQPISGAPELLLVGPGQQYTSLTAAGGRLMKKWNNGNGGPIPNPPPAHLILTTNADGTYFDGDVGDHALPALLNWPPWDGQLLGPCVVEGDPSKPPVPLRQGTSSLYYQNGLLNFGSFDQTIRNFDFVGFHRPDGQGNLGALWFEDLVQGLTNVTTTIEKCTFEGCDNAVQGGGPGRHVILTDLAINGCGAGMPDRTHNIYISDVDTLVATRVRSNNPAGLGHNFKTRAVASTFIDCVFDNNDQSTGSYVLDLCSGGIVVIQNLFCRKGANSDAGAVIHFEGENHDADGGVTTHPNSSLTINGLTMIAPPSLVRHPSWGITGLWNESSNPAASGKTSSAVTPVATGVKVFGLTAAQAGLPCTILATNPPTP